MYKFLLPIGDWSDDGHGKCEYYHILSKMPVEDVREAHFKIKEVTGIDVEGMCNNYQDSSITMELALELVKFGVNFDLSPTDTEPLWVHKDDMCYIWKTLLNYVNPELELVIENRPEMLPFYGYDKKNRHIGFVGYGCFH